MGTEAIILITILSIVFGLIVLYVLYLSLIYFTVTKKMYVRYNGHPLLKYFDATDFPGLSAEPFSFQTKNNHTLRGFIYTNETVKDFSKVILFFHGIGNGHLAYTKEINRLVEDNHLAVIAYDNHGSGLSEGKHIIDLSWPFVDAEYCLKYLKSEPRFESSKIYLIGHSWGGFVAGNIYHLTHDERIQKAVVLNGLPSVADVSIIYTKGSRLARRYYMLLSRIKMGRYANQSLYESLKVKHVPTLIAHGEKDPVVPYRYLAPILPLIEKDHSIQRFACPDHHHFVYLSLEAERELMAMQIKLKTLKGDALLTYSKTIDYTLIGQHNDALFAAIKLFISKD